MFSRLRTRRIAMLASLVIGLVIAAPGVRAEPPGGDDTTITKEGDGWKSTTTKDGKVVNEKHTDKDGHLTKQTDFDSKGKKEKETDYVWDPKAKREKKSKETTFRNDSEKPGCERDFDENEVVSCETYYDENGGRVRLIFVGGKPVRWEKWDDKKKQWVLHKVIHASVQPPQGPPVFTPGAGEVLQGVVIAAPETARPGAPIAFSLVSLKGEVLGGKPVRLTGDNGESVSAASNATGTVTATVPPGWKDFVITALGAHSFVMLSPNDTSELAITQAPPVLQPGSIGSVHGTGFAPSIDGNVVKLGNSSAVVLGASPTCIAFFVPKTAETGLQSLSVSAGSNRAAPVQVRVVSLSFDPGPSTLLAGQSATRNVRIEGTRDPMRIRIDDPSNDGATILNPGYRWSSGGSDNLVPFTVQAVRPGPFTANASINFRWPEFDVEDLVRRARVNRAGHRAEVAAAEANKNDYFADGSTSASDKARNRKAAAAWRDAARKWMEAREAWAEGDTDKALAAEAAARGLEGKAADALRR